MATSKLRTQDLTALLALEKQQVVGPVAIPPDIAKEILETRNRRNRRLSKPHVDRLTAAMKRGEFKFTGDPIRFYPDGDLADGQHRLSAAVAAGQTLEVVIVTRFNELTLIDGESLRRRASDVMALGGIHSADIIGPAILIAVPWLRAGIPSGSGRPTTAECVEYYNRNTDALKASAAFAEKVTLANSGQTRLKPGQIAALHFVAGKHGEPLEQFERFLDKVLSGTRAETEPEDSPTYRAGKLLESESDKSKRKDRLGEAAKYAVVVESYSMFLKHLLGELKAHRAVKKGVFPGWPGSLAITPSRIAPAAEPLAKAA